MGKTASFEKQDIQERLSKLSGGAATEAEYFLQENFDKEQSNQQQIKQGFATYLQMKSKDGGSYSCDFIILRKDELEMSRKQRKETISCSPLLQRKNRGERNTESKNSKETTHT